MDRGLFFDRIFGDDVGSVHSAQWANRGVSLHSSNNDYKRPQTPFKMMRFSDLVFMTFKAGLVNRKLDYQQWEWEEELVVLSLDYFVFPFTILIRKIHT